MVTYEGQAVFMHNSYLKVNFIFMFNLKLKLKLKFITNYISFQNQFKFHFISVFNFELTSGAILFFFLFQKFNSRMSSISANTDLVHCLSIGFYEYSQPLEFVYIPLGLQHMVHWDQLQLVQS